MAFKRALWSSGLTYRQICPSCRSTVQYRDDKLDFRPWFADGFVYCPKCLKPLRHNENYAIDEKRPEPETFDLNDRSPKEASYSSEGYCTQCGKEFRPGDKFCSSCGTKRGCCI